MVNTGGPSRACATCKKRKIKCDGTRPSCGQCIKSRRVCLGWKSEADLLFRDQTTHTAQRSARPQPGYHSSLQPQHTPIESLSFYETSKQRRSGAKTSRGAVDEADRSNILRYIERHLPTSLQLPLREQASSYFFNRFTQWKAYKHSFGFFQILESSYMRADPTSTLAITTEALAMMTLAKSPGQMSRKAEAAKAYARAVRSVSSAVADCARVRENGTLFSVILLSYAENIDATIAKHPSVQPRFVCDPNEHSTCKSDRGGVGHSWAAHATGAHMILKMRGWKEIVSNRESLLLAALVCSQNLTKGIFRAEPHEDLDASWGPLREIKEQMGPFGSPANFCTIGLHIPMLRWRGSQILRKPMCPGLSHKLFQLLSDTRAVDLELRAWITIGRPRIEHFIVGYFLGPVSDDPSQDLAWPGPIYRSDSIGAHAHNILRTYRIFLQLLIFNILERLTPQDVLQTHPEFLACRETLQTLVNEICGTIPYCLGYMDQLPLSPSPTPVPVAPEAPLVTSPEVTVYDLEPTSWLQAPATGTSRLSSPESSRMYKEEKGPVISAWYLPWPLYVAYSVITTCQSQSTWLRGRLRYVGEVYGIDAAMEYQADEVTRYVPGIRRPLTPFDFAPPAWEPLQ